MSNIVVSPHRLSTLDGINILRNGGNAIDAAIATNIVQGVVAPETCGIGGDLFALIWINGESQPYCLDSSGYAGSNVDLSSLISYTNIPLDHPMSVTVPGAVRGWYAMHERFGKGKVVEISGDFPNTKATVFFPSAGQKQLLLKFAKLQLI